jgi:pyruvate,water dikinase
MNSSEAKHLTKGEILVTSMTSPDFISAIKKAAAIVTNEGGILCHAAIVSREFGIPCIVGTGIATKSIKNGDLIEVDANHGFVRILKR